MKKHLLILILFTQTCNLIYGQNSSLLHTTTNPKVEESALKAEIISVKIYEQSTIVQIRFTSKGRKVNFAVPSSSCITDYNNSENKNLIIRFDVHKLNEQYNLGDKNGKSTFEFEFQRIAPGIELINIQIPGLWGYAFKGVSIINPDDHPKTEWNESKLKAHWIENGSNLFEGIYENTFNTGTSPKYKLALKKKTNGYNLIYLSGVDHSVWKAGDIKASLSETASPNLFKVKWYMSNKAPNENLIISFKAGIMKIVWSNPNGTKSTQDYLKLYPPLGSSSPKSSVSSGTGFALSSEGFIVTNQHIINNAKVIHVRGVNGNFSETYNAKIIIEDKNNNLAILKIDDVSFKNLGILPYTFKKTKSSLGEEVYCLGYPVEATMADDIKLTSGIISSKRGFQGDITTNQINFLVQSGNSGGPLFNLQGEIVGVINAEHTGAENGSYAIKTSYVLNLIQIVDSKILLPDSNTMNIKNLSAQVQSLKNFVYIIECK